MSLRYEQYYALRKTKDFLHDLLIPKNRPKTVKEMRERVFSCLRHFPPLDEDGEPYFSQDKFTKDTKET